MQQVGRTPAPVPAPERGGWGVVARLAAGSFAIGTDMFAVPGLLAAIGDDLGVTAGVAGLAVTVSGLTYAAAAPLLGAVLGARPARPLLAGAMVLLALGAAVAALAPTLPVLLAGRVLAALAAAVYVPTAGAVAVAAVGDGHRGRALGAVLGGASIAMVVGAPLGALLAAAVSWRAAFGMVVVLAAVTALGLRRGAAGVAAGVVAASSTLRERLAPLRSRPVLGTLAVTVLVMTASHSSYTYAGMLFGAGPAALGPVLATLGVAGLLGTWCGAIGADRGGSRLVVGPAVLALAAGLAALPLAAPTVAGGAAVAVVWGVAVWSFVPAQQHRLIGTGAGHVPLLLALNSAANHLGFAAGALFGGLVVDAAGPGSLWLLGVACCAAALVLHGRLTREVPS